MSQPSAFGLRAPYSGTTTVTDLDGNQVEQPVFDHGVQSALPDGSTLELGQRLLDGDGVIVTSDQHEIDVLQLHPALKSVSVPEPKPERQSRGKVRATEAGGSAQANEGERDPGAAATGAGQRVAQSEGS